MFAIGLDFYGGGHCLWSLVFAVVNDAYP